MSLIGVPLIVCAVLATVAVLAATILVWNRWGRLRFVLRPFGVLLTEALLVVSVGLVVNRSEQFYPTWESLGQSSKSVGTTYVVNAGGLDAWLRDHGSDVSDQGSAFPWQAAGWADWHLAGEPLVFTPAGYLAHTGWRYPTVLVLDDGKHGWTTASETAAARGAGGPVVVVFVRTTPATTPETLTSVLPAALAHDLRVTDKRWSLVAPAAEAALADKIVNAAPGRFPTLALVKPTAAAGRTPPAGGPKKPVKPPVKPPAKPPVKPPAKPPAKKPPAKPNTASKPNRPTTATALPVGIITTTVVETAFTAGTADPAGAADRSGLAAALQWACSQTPPPLAASTPAATSLPVYHSPHHAKHPEPNGSEAPKPRGGKHVTR